MDVTGFQPLPEQHSDRFDVLTHSDCALLKGGLSCDAKFGTDCAGMWCVQCGDWSVWRLKANVTHLPVPPSKEMHTVASVQLSGPQYKKRARPWEYIFWRSSTRQ